MTTARDKLLESAVGLIRSHGVAGTTVSDLLTRAGVARRSLYQNFPGGREGLLTEASRLAGAGMTEGLDALLATLDSPLDAVGAFTALTREALIASDFTDGCPVVASALAGTDVSAAVVNAGRTFTEWIDAIAVVLGGQGVAPVRAHSLANLIVTSVEGAVVVSIATQATEPLDAVATELKEVLKTA